MNLYDHLIDAHGERESEVSRLSQRAQVQLHAELHAIPGGHGRIPHPWTPDLDADGNPT